MLSTNPLFGLAGGDPSLGEIVFTTTGTPGAADYKTNGMRQAWRSGEALVRPIQALDSNGLNYTDPSFNGSVKQLVFAQSLPAAAGTAAWFLTYLQRVTLQLRVVGANVASNTVLLQMEVPEVIVENPWLVLEDPDQVSSSWGRAKPSRARSPSRFTPRSKPTGGASPAAAPAVVPHGGRHRQRCLDGGEPPVGGSSPPSALPDDGGSFPRP